VWGGVQGDAGEERHLGLSPGQVVLGLGDGEAAHLVVDAFEFLVYEDLLDVGQVLGVLGGAQFTNWWSSSSLDWQ